MSSGLSYLPGWEKSTRVPYTPLPGVVMHPKLATYLELMRLDRPVGTLLLLWPTLAALWLAADGWPPWYLVAVFSVGTFVMCSAGCVKHQHVFTWLMEIN